MTYVPFLKTAEEELTPAIPMLSMGKGRQLPCGVLRQVSTEASQWAGRQDWAMLLHMPKEKGVGKKEAWQDNTLIIQNISDPLSKISEQTYICNSLLGKLEHLINISAICLHLLFFF